MVVGGLYDCIKSIGNVTVVIRACGETALECSNQGRNLELREVARAKISERQYGKFVGKCDCELLTWLESRVSVDLIIGKQMKLGYHYPLRVHGTSS